MPSLLTLTTRADQPLDANTSGAAAGNQVQQPAFVTLQSLGSFSGASVAVTAAWKFVQGIISADWADSRIVPAVLAGLIGIFLFLKAIEGDKDLGPADWFGTILITVFNTAFLWAAACGIDVLGTAGAGSDSGQG